MKKYKIKYKDNNEIKSVIIELESIDLNSMPKNIVQIEELKKEFKLLFFKTIKSKDITLLFYELSLMLNSNMAFSDAIDILVKNKKNEKIKEFLKLLKFAFTSNKSIKEIFRDFVLDNMILSFLEIIQKNGNINVNIKTLYLLLKEKEETKKEFIKSISYPIVLLISFLISLISIFYFVIPKFEVLFSQNMNNLGFATKSLLFVENIFQNYMLFVIIFFILIIFMSFYFYKTSRNFRYFCEKFLVKDFYLFKDIYLNLQLYRLFLVIDIMLKANYEFYKALNSSKVLIKNHYLLDKISSIENLLYNGEKISKAFLKSELCDDIVLNLINTGEVSNYLPTTINEIKKIYKNRFDDKTKRLTSLIQPIFLVLIMSMILWIVLAIFVPIWDMGNMIKV